MVSVPTREVLAIAYACARTYGWVPASQDGSTKALVLQAMTGERAESGEVLAEIAPHLQEGRDLVDEMIDAGRDQMGSARGYISDLARALTRAATPLSDVGLVCSAVAEFVQNLEAEATSAQLRVGERVKVTGTVRKFVEVAGPASGLSTMLVVFDTDRGAMRVTTPAHWAAQLAEGDQLTIAGVVSNLELYRGRRRAVLARVEVCGP